jgi:Protein of unknown function (DUF3551)
MMTSDQAARRGRAGRMMLALAILGAVICSADLAEASARQRAPWCANLSGHSWDDCNYFTYEQCLVTVHGLGGACYRNPRAIPVENGPPVRRRRVYR